MYTPYYIHLTAIAYLSKYLTPNQFKIFFNIITDLLEESDRNDPSYTEEDYFYISSVIDYNVLWNSLLPHSKSTLCKKFNIKSSVYKRLEDLNIIKEVEFSINGDEYQSVCINPYILTALEDCEVLEVFNPLDFTR